MGRAAERFPERAREMRRRETDFSGERFDRQAGVQSGIDHLEHAPLGGRRQSTARAQRSGLGDAGVTQQQMAEAGRDCFDQSQRCDCPPRL